MRLTQKFGVCLLLSLWCAASALAQTMRIAQVKTVRGDAFIVRDGQRLPAKPGDAIYQSDVVTTGPSSAVGFTFIDNTVFSEGPDSELALEQFHFDASAAKGDLLADMRKGSLTIVSGEITHSSPDAMRIKTPTSILGVRGTTFAIRVY